MPMLDPYQVYLDPAFDPLDQANHLAQKEDVRTCITRLEEDVAHVEELLTKHVVISLR